MRNYLFLGLPLLLLSAAIPATDAQTPLTSGRIQYRMSSSVSADPADTTSLTMLFKPDLAVLTITIPQSESGTGTFAVLDYQQGKSQTFLYSDGDTTMGPTAQLDGAKPKEKNYDLRLTGEQKVILGYPCVGFALTSKSKAQAAVQLSGWMTQQIKSPTVLIPELADELPGFPLALTIGEIGLDGTVIFEARSITPLDTVLLQAYQHFAQTYVSADEASWRRRIAFYKDTTIGVYLPALPGWVVKQQTCQDLGLWQDSLKAGIRLHREALTEKNVAQQLEDIVTREGGYLHFKLNLPPPVVEHSGSSDQATAQQTWIYPNSKNYEDSAYPLEHNPYNRFPRNEELVEVYRAFVVKDVVCLLHVQTPRSNYAAVWKAVEEMLAQVTITGR